MPLGSQLEPYLYTIHESCMPLNTFGTISAVYADDTGVLAPFSHPIAITNRLQMAAAELEL